MRSFLLQLLQTRRIISVSKGTFSTQVGALFQLIQQNFTESGNPRLCLICYKMMMSLKKAADDLEVKKRELSMKITEMKSSMTFFLSSNAIA